MCPLFRLAYTSKSYELMFCYTGYHLSFKPYPLPHTIKFSVLFINILNAPKLIYTFVKRYKLALINCVTPHGLYFSAIIDSTLCLNSKFVMHVHFIA